MSLKIGAYIPSICRRRRSVQRLSSGWRSCRTRRTLWRGSGGSAVEKSGTEELLVVEMLWFWHHGRGRVCWTCDRKYILLISSLQPTRFDLDWGRCRSSKLVHCHARTVTHLFTPAETTQWTVCLMINPNTISAPETVLTDEQRLKILH